MLLWYFKAALFFSTPLCCTVTISSICKWTHRGMYVIVNKCARRRIQRPFRAASQTEETQWDCVQQQSAELPPLLQPLYVSCMSLVILWSLSLLSPLSSRPQPPPSQSVFISVSLAQDPSRLSGGLAESLDKQKCPFIACSNEQPHIPPHTHTHARTHTDFLSSPLYVILKPFTFGHFAPLFSALSCSCPCL